MRSQRYQRAVPGPAELGRTSAARAAATTSSAAVNAAVSSGVGRPRSIRTSSRSSAAGPVTGPDAYCAPADTRAVLVRGLEMLATKDADLPMRKHGNPPQ